MKNENNFTFINKPISYIVLLLMLFFFYLRFREIYPIIQIILYLIILIAGIYSLFMAFINDKKNKTTNFKEKVILIIILLILFSISYFMVPLLFK